MKAEKVALLKEYGKKCMLCRRKLKLNECTYHHIIPEAYGGVYTEENGAILCEPCHHIIHLFKDEEDGYKKLPSVIIRNKGV